MLLTLQTGNWACVKSTSCYFSLQLSFLKYSLIRHWLSGVLWKSSLTTLQLRPVCTRLFDGPGAGSHTETDTWLWKTDLKIATFLPPNGSSNHWVKLHIDFSDCWCARLYILVQQIYFEWDLDLTAAFFYCFYHFSDFVPSKVRLCCFLSYSRGQNSCASYSSENLFPAQVSFIHLNTVQWLAVAGASAAYIPKMLKYTAVISNWPMKRNALFKPQHPCCSFIQPSTFEIFSVSPLSWLQSLSITHKYIFIAWEWKGIKRRSRNFSVCIQHAVKEQSMNLCKPD